MAVLLLASMRSGFFVAAGVIAITMAACGARTSLEGPASSGSDASAPSSTLPCAGTGAPGTIAWTTTLGDSSVKFEGPVAADDRGWTYYWGTPASKFSTTYSLVALDSCGKISWRRDGIADGPTLTALRSVLVNGEHVIVQYGSVDAFDRTSGANAWHVDVDALAGENLGTDDFSGIGPIVAANDGTTYLAFETGATATLTAIDPSGATKTVATAPNAGSIVSLAIDGAGQLDMLINSALQGALVESFTPSGAPVFSASFSCMANFLGTLASASNYLVMQSGACVLTLQGAPGFSPTPTKGDADYGAIVIDGQDNLYATGVASAVLAFDDTGRQRWSTTLPQSILAGPLLATNARMFVLDGDAVTGSSAAKMSILDTTNGNILSTSPVVGSIDGSTALLTAAEHVIFIGSNVVTAVVAAEAPSTDAEWPTMHGDPEQRGAARGR